MMVAVVFKPRTGTRHIVAVASATVEGCRGRFGFKRRDATHFTFALSVE